MRGRGSFSGNINVGALGFFFFVPPPTIRKRRNYGVDPCVDVTCRCRCEGGWMLTGVRAELLNPPIGKKKKKKEW